ncbi:MAG: FAD-dependent oxidoreductase [Actinobacteria bacterium]|nr:FAD-dependent oxidoreductase [Actinomycetota bacterium]
MSRPRTAVVGGGYAGALAAVRLAGRARERAAVTLLEPRVELVQRLRLHQLATGQRVRSYDLARLTGGRVENVRGRAVSIDPERGAVAFQRDGKLAELRCDQVLVAVGSGIDTESVPGVAERAHSLAGPGAALRLGEALRALPAGARVAVCGAGFTGIEAVAEIAGARPDLRLALVARGRIGAALSVVGEAELRARLARLGVELVDGERVAEVEPGALALASGSRLAADLVVWCGGFAAPPLARDSGLPVDGRGLLAVDRSLRSVGHADVLGAGDAAAIPDFANGARFRMTCQAGMPSGAHAADTALAAIRGESPRPFDFGYIHMPLSLGRRDGVIQWVDRADRPRERVLTGRLAAVYKELVTRSAPPSIAWERRLPGMLRWPSAGARAPARAAARSGPSARPSLMD